MIIKVRKLARTNTAGTRIRASARDATATLTVAYDYSLVDPILDTAQRLSTAMGWGLVIRAQKGQDYLTEEEWG